MGFLFAFVTAVVLLTILACLLADKLFAKASTRRLTLCCGLIIPSLLLLLYPISLIWIQMAPSSKDSIDVDGMTMLVIAGAIAFYTFVSIVIGLPISAATFTFLRKKT
ncbi:hypothetical protein [Novosphingobium sp. Chol11]|uniref:hypothetical protein n=1 Tax=Novosphingobium sp. Chol11 TaxID=1385763 RepID=UPI0025D6E6B6|nr:hypothetical protein [Novosphingobium sp. Chol11]